MPVQALILLNDPLVAELSHNWGQQALQNIPGTEDEAMTQRIAWMYLSGFGRYPTQPESDAAAMFLKSQASQRRVSQEDSDLWASLAHVLVNTKEFIFLR